MENSKKITESAEDTKALAGELAEGLFDRMENAEHSQLICLWGDLGAGKTTFAQGLAKAMGVRGVVNSPTFLIMKKYDLSGMWKGYNLFHFDCYRVRDVQEIIDLGWEEILSDPKNIVLVEWPLKIAEIIPAYKTDVEVLSLDEDRREIAFKHF